MVNPNDTQYYDPYGNPIAPPTNSSFSPPTRVICEAPTAPSTSAVQSSSTISPLFVNIVNTFGLNILSHSINLEPTKSAGLCAMNIYHCLSTVAAGSKDKNLAAFAQVLNFTPELLKTMLSNTLALDRYSKTSSAVDFSSASAIFRHEDFILEEAWKNFMQGKFEAEIRPLQLEHINEFIERETRGKFKDLIKPDDLDGTLLMLATCLYFKAKWATPFKQKHTEKNVTFFGYEGEEMQCSMMYKCTKMEYVDEKKYQVAILPYKSKKQGPKWKAAIILPKERGLTAMHDILASFTTSTDKLRDLLIDSDEEVPQSLRDVGRNDIPFGRGTKVALHLPRFSLKLNLDLKPTLSKLGLGPAFIASDDFAPISKYGPLLISRVTHDLFLEVNEEGTEMAAVSIVALK